MKDIGMREQQPGGRHTAQPYRLVGCASAGVVPEILCRRAADLDGLYGLAFAIDKDALSTAVQEWKLGPSIERRLSCPASEFSHEPAEMLIFDGFGRLTREVLGRGRSLGLQVLPGSASIRAAAKAWPADFATYAVLSTLCRDALDQDDDNPWIPETLLDATFVAPMRENYFEDRETARPFLAVLLERTPRWADFYLPLP